MRKNGIAIFIRKLREDLDSLTKFTTPPHTNIPESSTLPTNIKNIDEIMNELLGKKNITLTNNDKEYINEICIKIKDLSNGKFSKIIELCESTSLSIRDFYTNKEYETKAIIKQEETNLRYYYGVKKLYKEYEILYNKYGVKNLPLSSDSKLEQRKIGINILKGIGNYSSIIRNFLDDSIKRVYMNDVMVRERNRVEKLKREKEERDIEQKEQRQEREEKEKKSKREQINNRDKKETTINNSKSKRLKKQIAEINKEIGKTTNQNLIKKLEKLKYELVERS